MTKNNKLENIIYNPFNNNVSEGVSIFTSCMNREKFLEEALESWVDIKEVNEIIIVDWSSDKSLVPLVNKFQSEKIFLAIVTGQDKFMLSCAYNLAARLTTKTKIFKVDCDIKISNNFFEKHILSPGTFFSGNWEKARNDNEMHLNGNVFLYREDYFKINGFNEYLRTYGWDDSDLYLRLQSVGLEKKDIDINTLVHMQHESRTQFIKISEELKNINDTDHSVLHTSLNRNISYFLPKWSKDNQMLEFSIKSVDNHTLSCYQVGEDQNFISEEIFLESEKRAVNEMLIKSGIKIPWEIFHAIEHAEIIKLYNLYLSNNPSGVSSYLEVLSKKYLLRKTKVIINIRNIIYLLYQYYTLSVAQLKHVLKYLRK